MLTKCQCEMIKGPIININNRFNEVFLFFDLQNSEFSPDIRIIDTFSSHFSFHSFNKQSNDSLLSHSHQLNNLVIVSSENPLYALAVTDTSIKNNMATSIAHIYICNRPIVKTLYHTVNVTSMEAELFAIRCGINQATNSQGISKIIIVTDLIHLAKIIFDSSFYPFQVHTAFILSDFRKLFTLNLNNEIKFWECPSQCDWSLHKVVNKETKLFNLIPHYSCKML